MEKLASDILFVSYDLAQTSHELVKWGEFMLDTYRYKVDFKEVKYYIDIHEVLKRDMDFPDYYGGNTDALWDCLTDMLGDPSYIEIFGF